MTTTHKKKLIGKRITSVLVVILMFATISIVAGAKDITQPTETKTGWWHSSDTVKQATGISASVSITGSSALSFIDINANMTSVKTQSQLKSVLAKSGNKKIRLMANITLSSNIDVNGKNIIYTNGYKLNNVTKLNGNNKTLNFCCDVNNESDFNKALNFNNGNYNTRIIIRKAVTLSNKKYSINNTRTSLYLNNQNLSIKEGGMIYINNNYVEICGGVNRTSIKSIGSGKSSCTSLIEIAPNKNNIYFRNFNVTSSDFYDNSIKYSYKDNSLTLYNMNVVSQKSNANSVFFNGASSKDITNVKITNVNINSNGFGLKGNYVSKLMVNATDKNTRQYISTKNSIHFNNSSYLKLGISSAGSFLCAKSTKENSIYFSNVKKSTIQSVTTAENKYGLVLNTCNDIYMSKLFASVDNTDTTTVNINNSNIIAFVGEAQNKSMNIGRFNCTLSKNIALNNVNTEKCNIIDGSKLKFNNVKFKNVSIVGSSESSKVSEFFFCGTTQFRNGFTFTNVTKFDSSKDVKLNGKGNITSGSYFTIINMMNTNKNNFILTNCTAFTPEALN